MASDTLVEQATAPKGTAVAVGDRRRVGGIGQCYEVRQLLGPGSVLIRTERTDEELEYPMSEAEFDPMAAEPHRPDTARFDKLVGQYRSIGPDGPKYQVVGIKDSTVARIWIIPNEDDDDYQIEDILLDPLVVD